jgi:uncharacterized protein YndB with AHSA1/START domain
VDQVTVQVDAPPQEVWALVTDVTRMGEWSPECRRCEWLDGANGPRVGARFKGWNRRGLLRWSTTCTVVVADAPSHFAFEVDKSRMRWGYRFEPDASGGTRVTEYREHLAEVPLRIRLVQRSGIIGRNREGLMVDGMRATLGRVKTVAEATP